MRFLIRTVVTAIGLWVATWVLDGITVNGKGAVRDTLTLLAVAVIFGLVNAILKPLTHLFGCAFYILTLGLFAFIVNALLFLLTGYIAQKLDLPFNVDGFWTGFWGAIIVTVVSWLVSMVIPDKKKAQAA
jgi:putative membrane protein